MLALDVFVLEVSRSVTFIVVEKEDLPLEPLDLCFGSFGSPIRTLSLHSKDRRRIVRCTTRVLDSGGPYHRFVLPGLRDVDEMCFALLLGFDPFASPVVVSVSAASVLPPPLLLLLLLVVVVVVIVS